MKEKRILIVCDSLDYLWISKTLHQQYAIEWAGSREDLSKYGESTDFDLLLIDIAFLRTDLSMLKHFTAKGVPVVALSPGPCDARDKLLVKTACCACYIKPFRQAAFISFVHDWIK